MKRQRPRYITGTTPWVDNPLTTELDVNGQTLTNLGPLQVPKGTAAVPGLQIGATDTGLAMFTGVSNAIGISTHGVTRMLMREQNTTFNTPISLKSYTSAGRPAPSSGYIGQVIYVTDGVGNQGVPHFSDGFNWRRIDLPYEPPFAEAYMSGTPPTHVFPAAYQWDPFDFNSTLIIDSGNAVDFSVTGDGTWTYLGSRSRRFQIKVALAMSATANGGVAFQFAKNGVGLDGTSVGATCTVGEFTTTYPQKIVDLAPYDTVHLNTLSLVFPQTVQVDHFNIHLVALPNTV